jgi:hypothetical protein
VVAAGLAALIAEHAHAIAGFGEDTRPETLKRAAERIRQTRFKIESYAAYLSEEKGRLEKELATTATKLRDKVEELAPDSETGTTEDAPLLAS